MNLFGNKRILEAEKIKNAVKTDRGDRLVGSRLDLWLGVEGDAETCRREHGKIIGAVTHGDCLLDIQVLDLSQQPQQLGFPSPR